MDNREMKEMMLAAGREVEEVIGTERFRKMGYILIVRTREAGKSGFYAITSDVEDRGLVASTLGIAAVLVERDPERMIRPEGETLQ